MYCIVLQCLLAILWSLGKIQMGLLLFNSKWATHQDHTLQITLMNEVYVFIKYIYLSLFVSFVRHPEFEGYDSFFNFQGVARLHT